MRNIIFILFTFLACSMSVQADDDRMVIVDNGIDGDARLYNVHCPDGRVATLRNFYNEDRICTGNKNGNDSCHAGSNAKSMMAVAKTACGQAQ